MKRLFALAPGLLLVSLSAGMVTADEPPNYQSSETIAPISLVGADEDPSQKDCGCEGKGKDGKGGGCSCYLFGPDEAFTLSSGENAYGITFGGWTQVGYHNKASVADFFNTTPNNINLHQQWLYAERTADGSCGWDWGFRADLMYGVDANNTQSFGNNPGRWDFQNGFDHGIYGWAIPQLYAEVAYGDLSVKAGHFYTLIGYEVVTAPDNFFYSHAFTMNNSEPFTHTGALATYNFSDDLTLYGGWTLGWDTGFDQLNQGNSWLGGFSYAVSDNATLTYISTAGNFGWIGAGDSYSHSVVVDVSLTEKLNYVFQTDLLDTVGFETVGINQYLFYTLNDCWKVGGRVEWWKPENTSVNAATFGLNYRPHANFVLRPEVKHEWVPAAGFAQTIFGMDAILTY